MTLVQKHTIVWVCEALSLGEIFQTDLLDCDMELTIWHPNFESDGADGPILTPSILLCIVLACTLISAGPSMGASLVL